MPILTIAIPSYNRPNQLLRILNSIQIKNNGLIEVLVIDDCSPLQNEITRVISTVNHLKGSLKYIALKNNLGFDQNLLNLVKNASGKYVVWISDDDVINSEYLEKVVNFLSNSEAKLIVTAYKKSNAESYSLVDENSNSTIKNNSEIYRVFKSIYQPKISSPNDYVRCIYNCILFSGIIVSRESLLDLHISDVKGIMYAQVLWGTMLASKYGIAYIKEPLITTINDGVIGFGTNSSEPKNIFLADRSNLFSTIEYDKLLFKTIIRIQKGLKTKFYSRFLYEYSLRSYQRLIRAYNIQKRKGVLLFFKAFMKEKFPLKINYFFVFTYFLIILITGNFIENFTKLIFSKSPAQLFKRLKGLD